MSKLESLLLAYNKLKHLEIDVFSGLINTGFIFLEENKLQYLHPDTILGLPNIVRVNLESNPGLQVPSDGPFINSKSLSYLELQYSNINSMSVKTFANVSAMEILDLT